MITFYSFLNVHLWHVLVHAQLLVLKYYDNERFSKFDRGILPENKVYVDSFSEDFGDYWLIVCIFVS